MANEEHLALLSQGVTAWNQWRREHPEIQPDLNWADLMGEDLREIDLSGTRLWGVNFMGANLGSANLNEARLMEANLINADLSQTNLIKANLSGADLNGANLSGADLSRADLIGAYLRGVDLCEAKTSGTYFNGADLRGAKLSNADLFEAHFIQADLSEADLSKAYLGGAKLNKATLSRTDLSEADLSGADLTSATLIEANLCKALLRRTILIGTDLTGAILTQCTVYGISAWDVELEGAQQDNLIITPDDEPVITVDDLEVAQFIYLLLNHKKLRNVLNAVTERGVLLLGRFGGGGLEVLQAVAARLREEKYLPIIFDFERPHDRDYTETVKTLAGLSRFIIADLSGPSVPQELYSTVPHFAIPVVPILEKGRKSYSMFVDLLKYDWVLKPPVEFADVKDLLVRMPLEVIAPAEEKHQARQQLLDELFNPK